MSPSHAFRAVTTIWRAALYLRMSGDLSQARKGVGRQQRECRQLAECNNLTIPGGGCANRLLRTIKDLERVVELDATVYFDESRDLNLATPTGQAVARTVAACCRHQVGPYVTGYGQTSPSFTDARVTITDTSITVPGAGSWVQTVQLESFTWKRSSPDASS